MTTKPSSAISYETPHLPPPRAWSGNQVAEVLQSNQAMPWFYGLWRYVRSGPADEMTRERTGLQRAIHHRIERSFIEVHIGGLGRKATPAAQACRRVRSHFLRGPSFPCSDCS